MSNFVTDSYLKVLAETATCEAETIEWEVFEKEICSLLWIFLELKLTSVTSWNHWPLKTIQEVFPDKQD